MRLGGELHGSAQCLLGLALGRGDVAQQHGVAGVDAEGGEAVLPQLGGVEAQLGEEEGDAGDAQVGRCGGGGRVLVGHGSECSCLEPFLVVIITD
jgi:hypothetical protein